jgi:hypothetical protein
MCLFALLAGFAPRLAFLFLWIARLAMVNTAFSMWIWPLLGLIFLPFTTLMYVLLVYGVGGLAGWDWLWIGLALVLDLGHYFGGYRNRSQIPYYPGA